MEQTGQKVIIPCFVITSAKPIWQGTVMDCAMVLGNNALVELGLQLVQADGSVVSPTTSDFIEPTMAAAVRGVVLVEATHLAPGQTKQVEVTTAQTVGPGNEVGIVTPVEAIMASKSCDLLECLWTGTTKFTIELNNWGMEPIIFKGQQVGTIEPATVIPADDPLWTDADPLWTDADPQVLLCQSSSTNTVTRQGELKEKLQYGEDLATADKQNLEQVLLSHSDVFALTDEELGETNLVTQHVDTGDARPVKTLPRWLPYVVRKELEEELNKLMQIGCVEPSSSPYASPLVLVRKKEGGLRVCVDYRNINQNTVLDRYPIPRIDELVDMVGRNKPKVFSSLDSMRGYHQVRMADDSKQKTAFTCHLGLFQYRRMPFGLTNALATF